MRPLDCLTSDVTICYLGPEWRAMQVFQTYFWGAKFPIEAGRRILRRGADTFDITAIYILRLKEIFCRILRINLVSDDSILQVSFLSQYLLINII